MGKTTLPKSFFKANPLKELSAANLAYFQIKTCTSDLIEQTFSQHPELDVGAARKESLRLERQLIEETDDPAALVELMRKGCDIFNQRPLCDRVLERQGQIMPLLLRRYRTTMRDELIDPATIVFARGEKQYAQQLRQMYDEIRAPFAKACACLVFGVQGMKEEIPFLLDEYKRFQREEPNESFDQHPLLALYILNDML